MDRRVIVIFPDGDASAVEAFRGTWDPLARSVPAHITLAYPFDDPLSAVQRAASLRLLAASVGPFRVAFRRLHIEGEEYLFLVADDDGATRIRRLHDGLYEGPLQMVPTPMRFEPHMTIGRRSVPEQIRDAERAAASTELCFVGLAAFMSGYRVEGRKRIREFDVPLG